MEEKKKNEMKDLCSNWPYGGSGPDAHDWSNVKSLLSHLIKMDEEMAQYHPSPRGHVERHKSIKPLPEILLGPKQHGQPMKGHLIHLWGFKTNLDGWLLDGASSEAALAEDFISRNGSTDPANASIGC